MNVRTGRIVATVATSLVLVVAVAACGDDPESTDAASEPSVSPSSSSTVSPSASPSKKPTSLRRRRDCPADG